MKKFTLSLWSSAPVLMAGALTLVPSGARAGVLAYEGFDYTSGAALGGLAGGTGWAAPWAVVNAAGGSLAVASGSLIAGVNAPAGYDGLGTGQSAGLISNFRGGRSLDTNPAGPFGLAGYLDGNGLIGATGKTLYFSFLQQPNGTGLFYEFEMHRNDLGDPGRIGGIGNDLGGSNVNLRAPNGTQTAIGAGSTDVNFYIVRIDFQDGNDDIRVYQNPSTATEPAAATLTLTSQADLSFNGISLGAFLNSRQVAHDEIRVGETWADMVTAVTPPAVAPQITVQPHPATSYTGGNVVLSTVVTGSPAPSLQWFLGNTALDGQTAPELSLTNLQPAAAGNYKLVATNASGTATSTITPVSVLTTPDGLIAYEGFDYPAGSGNLAGQNGGLGWGAPWRQINNASHDVVEGSLTAGGAGPAGFDGNSLGNRVFLANARRDGRVLDTTFGGAFDSRGLLDFSGNIGADDRTVYLSFLQQPNGTALFYELEFHRGDLGDGGRIGGIGNDQAGDNVHLRAPNGTHTYVGPGSTEVNFYVVRIDFKPGNDDVRVYQNPTGGTEPENATLTVFGQADMSFNGLSMGAFANGRTVAHDELRIGETWYSVVASPYAKWLAGFTFLPEADKSPAGDPDGDGLTNLLEYGFATDPTVSSNATIGYTGATVTTHGTPALTGTQAAGFKALFGRRRDFSEAGLSYTVQFTADLAVWQDSAAVPTVLASDATIDAVSVSYPALVPTINGTAPPRFFRVKLAAL